MKTHIITHRGLEPLKPNFYFESSREAFADELSRGYGLEFDVQFTADGGMIAMHDSDLKRISDGADVRAVKDIATDELLAMDFNGCHLATVGSTLSMIDSVNAEAISALHLKAAWQSENHMNILLDEVKKHDLSRFFVFDVMPGPARFLKKHLPEISIGVSLSHPYDITRYKEVTGGTLLSLDEARELQDVVDWAWLDEWDRTDEGGADKTFYNKEVFGACRDLGLNIALVMPEMHLSSPGILGGEAHQDARDSETLTARIKEILELKPDAVCTDRPDEVRALAESL